MSMSFDAIVLSGDLIPQALPLIRATWPAVDLTSWGNFVRFFAEPAATRESGVLGLRDPTDGGRSRKLAAHGSGTT
jgi:hypothetical protein